MQIFGIVGWKNNGKTTLVERVVAEITGRGITVSTIKHAHHEFDVDHPGKDSWRHRQAGATEVMVAGGKRWALMHELRDEREPEMDALIARLAPVDLVIVEGFKRDRHPKLEVYRKEAGRTLIARTDATVRMVASDTPISDLSVPVRNLDDVTGIADFILAETGLAAPQREAAR